MLKKKNYEGFPRNTCLTALGPNLSLFGPWEIAEHTPPNTLRGTLMTSWKTRNIWLRIYWQHGTWRYYSLQGTEPCAICTDPRECPYGTEEQIDGIPLLFQLFISQLSREMRRTWLADGLLKFSPYKLYYWWRQLNSFFS